MSSENDPSPTHFGRVHPYGADQPAAVGSVLAKMMNSPGEESIFIGLVTDCSTNSYSCTVTIPMKTAGFGVPCTWCSSGINRFGGCNDFCPPEIGSTVFVYLMKGSIFGVVLGQVPVLVKDPEYPGGGAIDAAQHVTAFNEDTGQVMKDLQMGGSALAGYQGQPNDAFPGDKGFYNELGVGSGIMRTMAYLKAGDLAKLEAFFLEDLVRLTSKNFDAYTGACDLYIRDDNGYLTSELCHTMAHWESLGAMGEGQPPGERPLWRHHTLTGYLFDLRREFVSTPALSVNQQGQQVLGNIGLAERFESSDGLKVERTIVGGGIVKSRQIGLPQRVRTSEAIEGSGDEARPQPETEDLSDFLWQYDKHGDITPQMRDALAWIIGRQGNAKLHPYSQDGKNPDFYIQDESEVGFDKGNDGANTRAGGHFRDMLDQVQVEEVDPSKLTKPRVIRINDAWVFVMPDGSITIRDGHATAITLTRGHVDLSASKDVNISAGRNVNIKAGHDINLNAHNSIDVTAGQGQARVFARKTVFIHSEDAGLLLSTNGPGFKGDLTKDGETFDSGGIILKPSKDSDVVIQTRSLFVQANEHILLGRNATAIPTIYFEATQMLHKVDQASWQLGGGKYVQFIGGSTTIDTDGNINTEGNVYALFGTMKMNSTFEEHKNGDFCNTPGGGYQILIDRLEPIYKNIPASGERSKAKRNPPRIKCRVPRDDSDASNRNVFDWNKLFGIFDRIEIGYVIFSLRTEEDYGTEGDDFSWTEQPWMREWSEAEDWGDDAWTKVPTITGGFRETWCYPGYKYWVGSTGFKKYTEENVTSNGNPKKRGELKKGGGEFQDHGFKSMKRHP